MSERRLHTRFQPSEGSGAILHDSNIGRINNIGMGGFKCICMNVANGENLGNVCEIFQNGMLGERLTFSINILNSSLVMGHPLSFIPEKQCRVRFRDLDERRLNFLADFIVDHCIF